MEFRTRSAYGPRVASVAPLVMDLSPDRAYRRGEGVSLQPADMAFREEVHAVVIEAEGRSLRVRVLRDVFSTARECMIRCGDEFGVKPEHVFSVHLSCLATQRHPSKTEPLFSAPESTPTWI